MRTAEAIAALALAAALAPAPARAADASVVLRWRPVEGAIAYELEIGADPELRRVLVRERVPTPGFRWRELPEDRRWWRVRGVDALGRPGRWSEVKTIEAALLAPEPRRPADGAALGPDGDVEFACARSEVLESYELEVAGDPEFAAVVERRQDPGGRFRLRLGAGAYHWRVRATAVDGRTTRWSPVRRLSVAAPVERGAAATPNETPTPTSTPTPTATATETATATATETPAAVATASDVPSDRDAASLAPPPDGPDPQPEPAPPPAAPRAFPLRAGARLAWHTNFGAISALSPGVEADWRLRDGAARLSVSVRLEYYGASSTLPPSATVAERVDATARVFPLSAALVASRPLRSGALYAGAGGQAQLVHASVAAEERFDLVPGVLLLAGAARRVGRGDVFLEAAWASGTLDGPNARVRTGGLSVAAGFRGWP